MRKSPSLARYLGIGNLLFIVLPLVLATAWSILTFTGLMRRSLADVNRLNATIVSSRFDEFFTSPRTALARVVSILDRSDLYPKPRLEEYLSETLGAFPFINKLQVVGPDDRIVATVPTDPDLRGISKAGEQVYAKIKDSVGTTWSSLYISTSRNQPTLTFGTRAGEFTVLCDLNLTWMGDFAGELRDISAEGVELRITDVNGLFLAHPDGIHVRQRERQEDFPRLREAVGLTAPLILREGGVQWLVSAARIRETGWYVFVMYPETRFKRSLLGLYGGLALMSLAASLVGVFLSRIRFRRIGKALAGISVEADRISRGDYGKLVDFGEDFSEFRRVGESLDGMIAGIREREETLQDRERSFREILEKIDLPAVSVGLEGDITFVNRQFSLLTGYPPEELLGTRLKRFLPDGQALEACPFLRILAGKDLQAANRCEWKTRSGEFLLIDWSLALDLDSKGKRSGVTGIGHDVTKEVRQHLMIEGSLREKEILLREMHHRVKNNLQLITSLLHLQGAETPDDRVKDSLVEASSRIHSMSLIHEQLYGSDDFAEIDIGEYTRQLASDILSDHFGNRVALRCSISPMKLTILEAIPCGLILNEALTNIRKYAFPDGRQESMTVDLEVGPSGDGLARIEVRDNGKGLPPGFDPTAAKTLGIVIMRMLSEQLGGVFRIGGDGGTRVEVLFRPKGAGRGTSVPA